ncbi:MAG: hypothetical protein U1E10_19200 [Bdellovibrionales bacterium]|nr:hypothetical protein [Bdellovibrionales bacterium]
MELWLIFAAIGVFVGGAAVYLAFMIFLPEWVGITGKTALETERSHRGDDSADTESVSGTESDETSPKS